MKTKLYIIVTPHEDSVLSKIEVTVKVAALDASSADVYALVVNALRRAGMKFARVDSVDTDQPSEHGFARTRGILVPSPKGAWACLSAIRLVSGVDVTDVSYHTRDGLTIFPESSESSNYLANVYGRKVDNHESI